MGDVESEGNSYRRRILIPVLALALALAGCPKAQTTGAAESACKVKVKRVCIDDQGNADPELIKVKKKVEIVVWIGPEGKALNIAFPTNPFPQPVICPGGNFCASLFPPNGDYKIYEYTATVSTMTESKTSDPRLEVVP